MAIPRLSEPLLDVRGVNGEKSIGTTEVTQQAIALCAQNDAQTRQLDAAQAHWHLDLLGRDERETNIRLIPHKGKRGSAVNGNFAMDLERVPELQQRGYNIYLQPNPGGTLAAEITSGIALFFEHDDLPKNEQEDLWLWLGLPQPSFQMDTGGKSLHQYFVLTTPIEVRQWVELMDRLIAHAGSDPSCKGANRMMRMAGGWYIDRHGDATTQSQILNATGERYDAQLLDELLPPLPTPEPCQRAPRKLGPAGPKNLRQICDALNHIPRRQAGTGTYSEYRNILWGLINACCEAGFGAEVAIDLMEDHSPSELSGWDVRQVAGSGGEHIGAGTFWWQAKRHGWEGHHA